MSFPCDRHLPGADAAYFRAVDVDAPPGTVFRWLCQLRAAPYSYDWVDNRGRRSPPRLIPGLDQLQVGQQVMTIFELVEFEPDRHLTVSMRRARHLFGEVAGTYMALPISESRSRLLVKALGQVPEWPVRLLGLAPAASLGRPGDDAPSAPQPEGPRGGASMSPTGCGRGLG
jgi:hypothetical protein